MGSYLERLCIFICLGDLLANFLPSSKFEKLYRYVAGILILLLVIEPLGKDVSKLMEEEGNGLEKTFEERIAGQDLLWDAGKGTDRIKEETERMTEAYLGQLTEEEIAEELTDYGYEIESEEGADKKVE
ncbi:MAG: stage III sporulation protein AF [Lachnospiraceae bacterium]|nr:stage III sporulation protein AF [Lachnospiraceae bacterium]